MKFNCVKYQKMFNCVEHDKTNGHSYTCAYYVLYIYIYRPPNKRPQAFELKRFENPALNLNHVIADHATPNVGAPHCPTHLMGLRIFGYR